MKTILSQLSWNSLKTGKFLLLYFCTITLIVSGIYSCTDHEELFDVDVSKDKQPIIQRSPTTVDDRVYFADFDEFKSYYVDLEDLLTTYSTDYFDSIIDVTTSVQTLNDVIAFSTIGTFGHISDPIMRSIVNANNEFQIDDVLITLINDSQWLLSDASNGTLKSSIRGMTKGSPIDTTDIPSGAQWIAPYELSDDALLRFWCGCRIRIEQLDCDEIRVWGSCSGFFGSNGAGDVTISFGTNTIIDEPVGNNFEYIINISQFQGVDGWVNAIADSPCLLETSTSTWDFYFDQEDFTTSCDGKEREMRETITSSNGNERMIIKTSFVKGVFTDNHVAEMTSETRDGNGNWNKSKANITVAVEANRKDGVCTFLDSKQDDESGFWRHRIVRVVWGGNCWHCDGDLVGDFEKIKAGITLTATQEVDFHCCDE